MASYQFLKAPYEPLWAWALSSGWHISIPRVSELRWAQRECINGTSHCCHAAFKHVMFRSSLCWNCSLRCNCIRWDSESWQTIKLIVWSWEELYSLLILSVRNILSIIPVDSIVEATVNNGGSRAQNQHELLKWSLDVNTLLFSMTICEHVWPTRQHMFKCPLPSPASSGCF